MADESIRLVHGSGECEIDLGRRELWVLGSLVPVGGRAFEIVEVLARSAGELVTKNELMDRIWPGAIVTENTLQVHAMAIRKALGPFRTLLKTQSGRGYRLLGDWTVRQHDAAKPPVGLQRMRVDGEFPMTNFPATVTDLIGRTAAVAQLRDIISAYRIVTLIGPGGIGKTSLARQVARGVIREYADGSWLVELASLSDPTLVPAAVAAVLRLSPSSESVTPEAVARAIGGKQLLLVLDNCEHVIDSAATLAETLLARCPHVTIMATSRETFRVQGEHVYRVPPLDVPAAEPIGSAEILAHSAAELFISRVREFDAGLLVNDQHSSMIAAICRQLDGIPLAIEFAAARAAALGIEQVAIGLRDRFAFLTNSRRTALPRHRTLRATLDWSYNLLPQAEQRLLRQFAVFPAGFTLDAAMAVMRDAGQDASTVVEGLVNLVDKSLVAAYGSALTGRWRLLETTRAYALEKLNENDETASAARAHAEFFRDFVAAAAPTSRSGSTFDSLTLCIREIDNVRAALNWTFSSSGDNEIGVALTAAYMPVWLHSGWYTECRDRAERALAVCGPDTNPGAPIRMQLHGGLGAAMFYMTAAADGVAINLTEALLLADSLGDNDAQLRWLWMLWVVRTDTGDFQSAQTVVERFANIARRGDFSDVLVADRIAGYTLQFRGDHSAARRHIERVLNLYSEPIDLRHRIWFLHDPRLTARFLLARSLWLQGFVDQAAEHARACLEEAKATGNSVTVAEAFRMAVVPIALAIGDLVAAERAVALLADNATRELATYFRIAAHCFEGELLIKRGALSDGVTLLSNTLESFGRHGWAVSYPAFQGVVAEGLAGLGRLTDALVAVEYAIAAANRGGERWSLPELLRIKGQCVLEQGGDQSESAADACFTEAINVAEEQGALFWNLRASMGFAELRVRQGRPGDAVAILQPVYDRFTEGFGTADLIKAKVLLDSF
jgi:predicted ATPase/DNA-binding winged helix-turn-helix (wHTH) protein